MKTRSLGRRLLTALLALLAAGLLASSSWATILTATKASATQTAAVFNVGYGAQSVTLYNSGSNEVFVAINAAATTASAEIPAGGTLTLDDVSVTSVGYVCSTGETTTLYIWAVQK